MGEGSNTRSTRAWLVGPVLMAAVLLGLTACGSDSPVLTRSSDFTGTRSISGAGLTMINPQDRQLTPIADGPSLDGRTTVSTADHLGKVVVLNVWESSCAPCRAEAADLVQASQDTKTIATFVGLNIRDPDPATAAAYTRSFKVTYPQVHDPAGAQLLKFAGTLPLNAIPSTVVIDQQGRTAARVIGTIDRSTLVQLVEDIAAGK